MKITRTGLATLAIVMLVLIGTSATSTPQAAEVGPGREAPIEKRAKWLEARLMAPCCRANPVADHYSGAADAMRREIRSMLSEGSDEAAILEFYVEKHGEQILAMPRTSGFGRLAYLAPLFVLLAGALAVGLALARWRRPDPDAGNASSAPAIGADDALRLEREIRRHD